MTKYLKLTFFLLAPLLTGFLGSVVTSPAIGTWYAGLNKPFFNPPSWLFAPVWTMLYLMMGYASYLISESNKNRKFITLNFYWVQLMANFFWSFIFFGLKLPAVAFIEIVVLWLLIFKTQREFFKISRFAGYLLIPYLIWVSFASLLNLSIVLLN